MENLITNTNGKQLSIHLGKMDETWREYSLYSAPILIDDWTGKQVSSKYKAIIKGNKVMTIMRRAYALYPNEEAIRVVDKVANGLGFKRQNLIHTNNYGGVVAAYLSDKLKTDIARKGDTVKFGFVMKNSIDGSMPFSFAAYNYRLVCTNGMIAPSAIGEMSMRHMGSIESFTANISKKIQAIMEQSEQIMHQYNTFTKFKMTRELADELLNVLPEKYLPSAITYERKDLNDKKSPYEIKVDETKDLWSQWNCITDSVWHSEKTDIKSRAKYIADAMAVMNKAVAKVKAEKA